MPAPESIRQLVERFEQHRDAYRAGKYNETQLRREFLDPFFEALGWDVFNRLGYSEENKHVIHEDSLEIEGAKKAPDYAFKVGKERKFFVEAKKPSVRIETNPEVAFQLKRYVWSAKLPLGILTDFEEFAIYECRSKPKVSDSVKTGRVLLLNYTDYIERWDEIVSIFSHDAVMTGGFDKFAKSVAKKKGTAEVDSAFLAEIEGWREALAKNVALRNKLRVKSEADLNFAVQMTIDRIIFLRICEDRGYESEYQLQELAKRENIYNELKKLFERADRRYNSGLFHFKDEKGRGRADTFTTGLEIDDKVLKDIIKDLYYPAPYVFALIPADILGQIYEQFLGKVIRLTASGNAKVEEKPEVRKAGGVYYTPTFIVDTIVENTIGKLVSGKLGIGMTPKEVTKLRIVDPACGSGTFLLGAYQYLLDWHLNWYLNNDFEKWSKGKNAVLVQSNPARFKSAGGARGRDGWKLSVEKKKEILLNNIYGVDIDPQAVEVTKLSLLLKVIEDPGQLSYLDERILPDLGKNIQCGNSLIGLDYWDGKMREMISEEERARVNAFDWKAAFPEVFAQGAHSTDSGQGFDVVVGNPPYIRIHNLIDYYPDEVRFIQSHYLTASFGKVDIFVAFVEKGMQILKKTGMLGFILPNKFMQSDYGVGLRTLISEKQALTQLIDFGNAQVFNGATTYTCLLFLSNSPQKEFQSKFNKTFESPERFLQEAVFETRKSLSFSSAPWQMASSIETTLLEKLETAPARLSDMVELAITGVKTGANSIFIFEIIQLDKDIAKLRREDTDDIVEIETKYLVRYLKAESLKRYRVGSGSRVLLYPYESVNDQTRLVSEDQIKNYPKTWQYLNKFKHDLESRQKGKLKGASWYGLSFSSSLQMFSVQKIITPTLSPRNSFSLDVDSFFFPQGAGGGCGLVPKENISAYYLLGLLNSRLLTFFFQRISSPFQGGWYAYEPRYLTRIPIHPINLSNPAEKAQHDKMVSLVERMLALQKSLQSAHNPQEADRLTREVESTDKAIDNLVYELYGLTEEEIGIVEGK